MTRTWRGIVAVVAMGAMLGGVPRTARADEPPGDVVEIRIDAGFSVPEFLKTVSEVSKRQILWSPDDRAIVSKKFAAGAALRVPRANILEAARALLVPLEIVLVSVEGPGLSSWYAMDMRTLASQFVLRLKPEPVEVTDVSVKTLDAQDGRFVTAIIRVENVDNLRDTRGALQRLITQNNVGSVQEMPAAKAFLVTDFAPNVAAVYRAIRLLDVPRPPAPGMVREFFVLQHASAVKVRNVLDEQFGPPRRVAPNEPPPPVSETDPRISYDEDTKQVIVSCRADLMDAVRRVVAALDKAPK